MERGTLAIFGGISSASSKSIKSFVNFYNIPFITWNEPSYKLYDNYLEENDNNKYTDESSTTKSSVQSEYEQNLESIDNVLTKNKDTQINSKANNDNDSNFKMNSNFLINMHPEISPVLISFVKYNRHRIIYYLYNHESGLFFF